MQTEQLLKDFEQHLLIGGRARSSARQYVSEVRLFVRSTGRYPADGGQLEIQNFLVELLLGKRHPYAPSTIQRKLASLRVFFGFLVEKKILAENPCDGLRSVKVPKKQQPYLREEQINQLLNALPPDTTPSGKKSLAMITLLYYLGLRVSELSGLCLHDFVESNPPTVAVHGKGGKVRILSLIHPSLQSAFSPWWGFRKTIDASEPALFINLRTKSPLSVRTIQRRVRKYGEVAKLPLRISPHILRRSFATHLLNRSADLFTIASLLGHASLHVTQRYAIVTPKRQEETLLLLP